jgi:hypothetical protein
MDGVVEVDPDAAVEVLAGVRDPLAPVGGPELGDRQLVGRGQARRQPPGRLPGGEPDGLGVDVGVRGALGHRLERADLGPELFPFGDVLGGDPECLRADASLEGAEPGQGVVDDPGHHLGTGANVAEHGIVADLDLGEGDVPLGLARRGLHAVAPSPCRAAVSTTEPSTTPGRSASRCAAEPNRATGMAP